MSVTPNLFAGLTHIRSETSRLLLWIDALCINQEDLLERSRQVSLMRDLYTVAEEVLVWLGPAAETIDASNAAEVYEDMAARPYWTRVWILQEFILGSKVTIQCGHFRVALRDFDRQFPKEIRRDEGGDLAKVLSLRDRYKLQRGFDVIDAFELSFSSRASDLRDHVYGVRGLFLKSSDESLLPVDYTLSPCQVYKSASAFLSSRPDHLLPNAHLSRSPESDDHDIGNCTGHTCGTLERLKRGMLFHKSLDK